MENEIMTNEEVLETVENVAEDNTVSGWAIAAVIGAAALVGIGIYKGAKKVIGIVKAKKEAEAAKTEETVIEVEDYSEEA